MKSLLAVILSLALAGTAYAGGVSPTGGTGTGGGTPGGSNHSVQFNSSNALAGLLLGDDQTVLGVTGANPVALSYLNCGDATHALAYSTSTHTFSCQAITATATPGGTAGAFQWNNAGSMAGANITANDLVVSGGTTTPVAYGGTSCTNKVPTALSATGAATCTTLTSSYVDNSIAVTGGDINTSSQVVAIGGVTPGTVINQNNPAIGGLTGSSWVNLEQIDYHAMPTASGNLTCTAGSGNFPFNDIWVGALSGANVSLALPSPASCAIGSIETLIPSQDAAHTFAVTGTIQGTPAFTLGTTAGNTITQQYVNLGATWKLQEGQPYPAQALPLGGGGTGSTVGPTWGTLTESTPLEDAPMWMHYLGDGGEADPAVFANANCTGSGAPVACCTGSGTGTCTSSQTIQGLHYYANFTVGTGATLTVGGSGATATAAVDIPRYGLIVVSPGTCTVTGTIAANGVNTVGATGSYGGGASGGGGFGASNGAAGNSSIMLGSTNASLIGAGQGGTSGVQGGDCTTTFTTSEKEFIAENIHEPAFVGGATGGVGQGNGAGNGGGGGVILDCATINYTGTINAAGANGTAGGSNIGGNGGGGGGFVIKAAHAYTANTGTSTITGGTGGAIGTGTSTKGGKGCDGFTKDFTLN